MSYAFYSLEMMLTEGRAILNMNPRLPLFLALAALRDEENQ